jgi:hypothetical protein
MDCDGHHNRPRRDLRHPLGAGRAEFDLMRVSSGVPQRGTYGGGHSDRRGFSLPRQILLHPMIFDHKNTYFIPVLKWVMFKRCVWQTICV